MSRARIMTALALAVLVTMAATPLGCVQPVPPEDATSSVAGDTTSTPGGSTNTPTGTPDGSTSPGVLQVKAFTDSLGAAARLATSAQYAPDAPDDVDVNLTPTEYSIAFKRIVLKQVNEETNETLAEVEVFSADTVADALVVDLLNSVASDLLEVDDLEAGTYNKVDIEVFYLDMTVATIYPGTTSHDISYRMVFDTMGALEQRDFLLYLEPSWMEGSAELADSVVAGGWYWMEMSNPDHVVAVAGASSHPEFPVLDLFANDEFWSSEHKVLEGGRIDPPLEYDPTAGAVLTISFDVTGKFNFKDYHDETTDPDGLWEIRKDVGIHPFPPDFDCLSQSPDIK